MLSGISITLSWHKGKSWWKYIYTSTTYIYIYTYENRYRYKCIWSPQSAQGQLQKQRWKAHLLQTAHPLPQTKCTSALDTVIVVASVSFGQCTTWRSEEVAQIVRFFDSLDILSFARGCEADDKSHQTRAKQMQKPTNPLAQCACAVLLHTNGNKHQLLWAHNISIRQGIVQTALSYWLRD